MPSGFRGVGEAVSLHDPRVHRCLLARRLRRRRRWGLAGQRRGQMPLVRRRGRGRRRAHHVQVLCQGPVVCAGAFERQGRWDVVQSGHAVQLQAGLQTEAELGPRCDGGRGVLGGGGRRGHGEAPLSPDGVDHLAPGSLGPQGTDRF